MNYDTKSSEVKTFLQVQLLYSDPSLGARVEFLIKRLEILQVNMPMPMPMRIDAESQSAENIRLFQTDPRSLSRSYNIDRYLASFCAVSGLSEKFASLLGRAPDKFNPFKQYLKTFQIFTDSLWLKNAKIYNNMSVCIFLSMSVCLCLYLFVCFCRSTVSV